ncbi:MAG: tetratricopeptide repeat protein [Myxococcota bacterium]|nr:tetratricopeptide repeat protein [Myxococcota bacterium]
MQRRNLLKSATLMLAGAAFLLACGPSTTVVKDPDQIGTNEVEEPKVKEEALKQFTQALSLTSSNPQQAIKLLKDAVDEDPKFGEAWYNLGLLQEQMGDAKAEESYKKAIETRPKMPEAYVNLGIMLIKKGDKAKAKELFAAVVDDETGFDTFHVEANLNLGLLHRLNGEAIVAKANEGNEGSVDVEGGEFTTRTYVVPEEAKPHFGEAVRHVRKALAGDSNNINCYENLAAIYYAMDNLEVAKLVCEQAIQKQIERNKELQSELDAGKISQETFDKGYISDQAMAPTYNTFGLVWLARGEVALAYINFKKAAQLRPNFIEAQFNVAGVALNVQDYNTAFATYQDVLKLDPNNREAKLSLAVAVRGLGQLEEADKMYDAMLKEDAAFAPALFNKAILYQEYYRDLKKAKELYEQFMAMPSATELVPVRVAEAKKRIEQIEMIWLEQQKSEEEARKMQREMEKMQREMEEAQRRQEEMEKANNPDGSAPDGSAPDGSAPDATQPDAGATP